jgi:hypothetical protein
MLTSHDAKEINLDFSGTPIPKKIHYVWLGGRNGSIPVDYLKRMLIAAEIAQKSGFEVILWVNEEKIIYKAFQKLDLSSAVLENPKAKKIAGIHIKNINELFSQMKEDSFFKENNRYKRLACWINQEMIGFKNLAAASDLLRYIIMILIGGYYTDPDNKLLFKKGQKFEEETLISGIKVPLLFVAHHRLSAHEVINCFIASVPQHPLMKNVIDRVLTKFKSYSNDTVDLLKHTSEFELEKKFKTNMIDLKRWPYKIQHPFGRSINRRILTIDTSGPDSFSKPFEAFWDNYRSKEEKNPDKLAEMGKMFSLRDPIKFNPSTLLGNIGGVPCQLVCDNSWLKQPPKTFGFDDARINIDRFFTAPKILKKDDVLLEPTSPINKK